MWLDGWRVLGARKRGAGGGLKHSPDSLLLLARARLISRRGYCSCICSSTVTIRIITAIGVGVIRRLIIVIAILITLRLWSASGLLVRADELHCR